MLRKAFSAKTRALPWVFLFFLLTLFRKKGNFEE